MKACSKCKLEKEDSEFYKDKRSKTGLYSACKKCSYIASRLCLEKSGRKYSYKYNKYPKRTEYQKEYQKKYQLEYQRKNSGGIEKKTRERTKFLIRSGKLKRGNCEVCGLEKAEAHHTDYNDCVNVRWLCKTHHAEEHRLLRKITNKLTTL